MLADAELHRDPDGARHKTTKPVSPPATRSAGVPVHASSSQSIHKKAIVLDNISGHCYGVGPRRNVELANFRSYGASVTMDPRKRGGSSVGRALEWHSRGRGFDPLPLHFLSVIQSKPANAAKFSPHPNLRSLIEMSAARRTLFIPAFRRRLQPARHIRPCGVPLPALLPRPSPTSLRHPGRDGPTKRRRPGLPIRNASKHSHRCSLP